jgi:hypothetical protein
LAHILAIVIERATGLAAYCAQSSQFVVPSLELFTTGFVLIFYRTVEKTQSPKGLILATAFFAGTGALHSYKIVALSDLGFKFTDVRIFLPALTITVILILLFFDLLLLAFKVNWRPVRRWMLRPKSAIDLFEVKYLHPYSNLPSRLFFFWLNPFLRQGYSRPLEIEHLGKLPESEKTNKHYQDFCGIFDSIIDKERGIISPCQLWKCYIKFCSPQWIFGGILRLFTDLVGFVAPLSVHVILTYISTTSTNGHRSTSNNQHLLNTTSLLDENRCVCNHCQIFVYIFLVIFVF